MSERWVDGRVARGLFYALGAGALANGAYMLLDAAGWFARVASATGALNVHFVRDVGAAYATAGVALVAAVAGTFLALHAATHLYEAGSGAVPAARVLEDLPGVHLPALLVCALAAAALRRPAAEVR